MGTEGEKYFELVADIVSTRHKIGDGFACPCCSTPSFLEAGCWEICDNCGWEDDPVQER